MLCNHEDDDVDTRIYIYNYLLLDVCIKTGCTSERFTQLQKHTMSSTRGVGGAVVEGKSGEKMRAYMCAPV